MRSFIFLISLLLPQFIFATNYLCPSTNQYVATGDTLGQVMMICGQPTKIIEPKTNNESEQVTQLLYQRTAVKQNKLLANDMRQYQLDIQISNNKIVGILVNGQSVQSTNSCYNTTIKIGDPIQNVLQYCGKPFLVTQTMAKIKNTEPIKLIYSPNDYT